MGTDVLADHIAQSYDEKVNKKLIAGAYCAVGLDLQGLTKTYTESGFTT